MKPPTGSFGIQPKLHSNPIQMHALFAWVLSWTAVTDRPQKLNVVTSSVWVCSQTHSVIIPVLITPAVTIVGFLLNVQQVHE